MKNLTKQNWIDIRRESAWYNELRTDIMSKFLKCKSKRLLATYKKYEGAYNKNVTVVCLEDFLKENGYNVVEHIGLTDSDYCALHKEDIELKPGVYKRCIVEGLVFLERKKHRFVLEFQESYNRDDWHISLTYRPEDEKLTLEFLTKLEQYAKDHNYLKKTKIDPSLEHIKLPTKYTWEDVILPDKVKTEVQDNIDTLFKNIDVYKKTGICFKRGVILQGVPGTGKTLIGKVLCQTCDCSFIWVTPKYLTKADHISSVCRLARAIAPSILFLEDIDLYGEDRQVTRDKSILGELMNQLDGLIENEYVVVVATTNEIKHVEKALRNRPGRFDRIIEIPKPDTKCRLQLLELFTKDYKLKNVDLQKIAKSTDGLTGAHMKELVMIAVISAIEGGSITKAKKVVLTEKHFRKNISKVKAKKIQALGFKPTPETDSEEYVPSRFD